MKRLSAFAMALGLVLGAQSALQADPINWSYSWSVTPIAVPSDPPGTGSVSLTNNLSGTGANTSFIVATNLVTNSSSPDDTPDTFTGAVDQSYQLDMTLTDTDSGDDHVFSFTGHFTGTLSQNSANIANTFDSPTLLVQQIGDNIYTVEIGPYVPPGPPSGEGGQGAISAKVSVEPGQGPPNDVPEPSTLLLSGLGLSVLGLVARRQKA